MTLAEKTNIPMDKLSVRQFKDVDARFDDDVLSCLDYERAVELKDALGGTSRSAVMQQIEVLKKALK